MSSNIPPKVGEILFEPSTYSYLRTVRTIAGASYKTAALTELSYGPTYFFGEFIFLN